LARNHPFQILGYHSCDRDTGLKVLNGIEPLIPSHNPTDWLGHGTYFWEQDPKRALNYAIEVANGKQWNKKKITAPFVLGAIIELGNCLNLVESQSFAILDEAYKGLIQVYKLLGEDLPVNMDNQRRLDCAVIQYIHKSRKDDDQLPYETVRSAFDEGVKVYPNANFSIKNHIQVCVLEQSLIKGYFLPFPIEEFNPYLKNDFVKPA
jgi:hypothetical protein